MLLVVPMVTVSRDTRHMTWQLSVVSARIDLVLITRDNLLELLIPGRLSDF